MPDDEKSNLSAVHRIRFADEHKEPILKGQKTMTLRVGDEFGNPDGYCPECDSAAVRALKVATDGGEKLRDDVEHAPDRPLGTAQARKVNRNALRASLHERGFIGVDVTMHNRDYALVDLSGVPEPRQEVAEVYFESWGAAFRERDVQGFGWGVRI